MTNYYPRIITDLQFDKVREYTKSRKSNKTGRKDQNYNNLFASFIKCPYCGGPLNIDTNQYRAHKVKVYKYLYCSSHAQGRPCTKMRVRYDPFETAFLHHITAFDISEVFNESNDDELLNLETELHTIKSQISQIDTEIESLFSLATHSTGSDAAKTLFTNKLDTLADSKNELETKADEVSSSINRLQMNNTDPVKLQQSISSTVEKLKNLKGDELYLARAKLAQIIKNVVDKVYVYIAGWPMDSHKKGDNYLYHVKFHNGAQRIVGFSYIHPEKYKIILTKITDLPEHLTS
ncbi:MAG: recombinase zinc beta ribbon domain-containing protein [gamma proteobacterium symbiont of Lucinoma myriamae]|nr:recombinase zinc beta ribbon domain-containing protein [gamma proteobacterium symbiont of Lucinoma myriamae]